MKKGIGFFVNLLVCIVSVFFIVLGYSIIQNLDGIVEDFVSFPRPYLFLLVLGIFVGRILTPFIYNRISSSSTKEGAHRRTSSNRE